MKFNSLKFFKKFQTYIKIISGLLILTLVSSCLTKYFWEKQYDEVLRQFLVSKNGAQTVIIGEKYHYIFDDNSRIIADLLLWKKRRFLYIDLENTYLKVDRNNNVTGHATIKTNTQLLKNEYDYLVSLGFAQSSYGILSIKLNLKGKRYLPKKGANFYGYNLNNQYKFKVNYEKNEAETAMAIAVTPITVAVDATLWIGNNILLAPFKN